MPFAWALAQTEREYHVIPLQDLRDHDCEASCWCRPVQDVEDLIYSHNSLDGREAFEAGGRKVS